MKSNEKILHDHAEKSNDIFKGLNPFMHDVWLFYNIMHERVRQKGKITKKQLIILQLNIKSYYFGENVFTFQDPQKAT